MHKKLNKEDIKKILAERFKEDNCTHLSMIPHPSSLKDAKKAALRVEKAIKNKEKILVVGDYDVDGVVSSVIITEFFDDIGVETILKIPNRFKDGYGLNKKIVEEYDVDLIITVDNGISAAEAAEICKNRGIDLIITDHHTPPEILPDAFAIINPKQEECSFPNQEICGAQVAWYFIASIKEVLGIKYNLSKFLDILAIAIIADMMELRDINRVMVRSGMKFLDNSKRPAFGAIKKYFHKRHFKSEDISFLISPLLNSSGRMEDANYSYEFLRSKTEDEAISRLENIVSLNLQRREIEHGLFQSSLNFVKEDEKIIVAWGEDWHEGVIGIVASRLSKKFKKPAIIFSITGDKAKGSARSVGSINILKYIEGQKNLLLGYGGHRGAAGAAIEKNNLKQFKKNLEEVFLTIDDEDFIQKSEVLGEIDANSIDFELLEILESFEPYGQKNPVPKFLLNNAYVKVDRIIGRENNHQKLILTSDRKTLESLYFNFDQKIDSGKTIDLIFSISKNEFRGVITPQLLVKQILSYK